jgi:hypothetical protein
MPPIAAIIANFRSDELIIAMLPWPLMDVVLEFVFCAIAVAPSNAKHIIAVLSAKPSLLLFPMFVLPLECLYFVIRLSQLTKMRETFFARPPSRE